MCIYNISTVIISLFARVISQCLILQSYTEKDPRGKNNYENIACLQCTPSPLAEEEFAGLDTMDSEEYTAP